MALHALNPAGQNARVGHIGMNDEIAEKDAVDAAAWGTVVFL